MDTPPYEDDDPPRKKPIDLEKLFFRICAWCFFILCTVTVVTCTVKSVKEDIFSTDSAKSTVR